MDQPQSQRRPRVHFDPSRAKIYEMGMIQHGWEALEALHRFRWLTSWQVAKLLFLGRPNPAGAPRGAEAARNAANERCLRRLKDRQLVATKQVMLTHGKSWRRQEYNILTKAGHLLLRDHLAARGETLPEWEPDRGEIAPEALPHALAVNDVGIALARSAEYHGWDLLAWIDDFAARRVTGQVAFGSFVPDAASLVRWRDTSALYFIEVDRGTEPVDSPASNSWATKMARYRRYLEHGFAEDAFIAGQPAPLLLTVTTTATRLSHLMSATRDHGPFECSWFTTLPWIEPPFDLLGTVWRRPHAPDVFFSLLDNMALRSG